MKRTATTLVLLAGLGGGGCISSAPPGQTQQQQQYPGGGGFGTVTRGKQIDGLQGPGGEPVMAARGMMPAGAPNGVQRAGGANTLIAASGVVRPVSGLNPTQVGPGDGCTNCIVPGVGGGLVRGHPGFGHGGLISPGIPYSGQNYGHGTPQLPSYGILPVPSHGPPGAVAAHGAITPGLGGHAGPGGRPGVANGRTSIKFTGPAGMKVTWQLPDGSFSDEAGALTAPKEYNFLQGQVYRLRLTQILPDHPGVAFYPTLEVASANPKTLTFLSHSSVPITFSADDFAQAKAGNLVVKVVYLPDPINQDFSTLVGAEEVVSTRLEPGADPVAEAQRRGTVLAIIRMGNIDLENRISPSMTAPPPSAFPPGVPFPPPGLPPGLPPGVVPRPNGNGGLNSLPPLRGPMTPTNPPGTATIRPPATLPPLAPSDLPPPIAPKKK
ncbi:MAG: hypothetical protein L0241_14210, partial [Planctomycetia bacterium]|nr:hypothetical protein [Planctomycetia bacterium]